ncbi:MAG: VWA domain-containing protein, partial [Planctomycetota bacterium]
LSLRPKTFQSMCRGDKLYIKQFQEETQLQVMLAVDASESMRFGSIKNKNGDLWTKYDYATTVAATLAYLATAKTDAVGLAIFDEQLSRFFKPGTTRTQWKTIVNELQAVPNWNKTGLGTVLQQVAGQVRHRSLIILISDFFDDADSLSRGLRALRFKRHDVVCLQVLDPQELDFPFDDVTQFKGLEQAGELLTEPRQLRKAYLDALADFEKKIRRTCRSMDIDFARFSTGDPLDVPLSTFLGRRNARIGKGA